MMDPEQFQNFRGAILLRLVDAHGECLTAPTENTKTGEPFSREWRLAVTANDIALTCCAVWAKADAREADRNRR